MKILSWVFLWFDDQKNEGRGTRNLRFLMMASVLCRLLVMSACGRCSVSIMSRGVVTVSMCIVTVGIALLE